MRQRSTCCTTAIGIGWCAQPIRYTANEDQALDVLQDTFAYFLSKFPGFELRKKLTTFLYPAVKN